jgi:hypothetical protein
MDNEVQNHLVVEKHDDSWNIVSVLFLDSFNFPFPGVDVTSDDRFHDEVVEVLVLAGGGWVFWGAHVFVVALEMLVQEVRVHELGVSPGSNHFVHSLLLVNQFVSSDGIETTEEAPLETEQEVLAVSLWLQFKPVTVDFNLVTHDDKSPNPRQRFKNIECVERDPESLVVEKCSLTFLSEVLIILCDEFANWTSHVHEPNGQK